MLKINSMMNVIGVIPARYGSSRFPGKPLTPIGGKPLLQWVIERSLQSKKLSQLIVATDDQRIYDLAESLDVKAVMTDSDLPSGSDRVWAAVQNISADVVINIQGDEPLISGELIDELIVPFESNPQLPMSTLARKASAEDIESKNTAKIVTNNNQEAIYFSRFPIPYSRESAVGEPAACLKHIGMYGYSKSFLQEFCSTPPTEVEKAEGLEQLRALYLGAKIKVVLVEHESWGVDTPEDVKKVEKLLGV